jgi:NitT/TauT family transport system ATP-binding protein
MSFALPNGHASMTDRLTVLDNISLEVRDREFLTLLGPSGCGKTTLLRSIAGLVPLTRGEILLDGAVVSRPHPRLSMVFQSIGLVPWKTVFENVALGLELQLHRRLDASQKEEVATFVELVGLKGFESYFPYQISGGMQQRVGLARALVRKPEVLLMDEPFGALDAQTRAILQEELLHLWGKTGSTVVFVTHDLDEAIYLSDRILLMTRRPGRPKLMIDVNLPRPRYSYDVRAEPEFVRLRQLAWNNLKEEISQL